MLKAIGQLIATADVRVREYAALRNPWTNVYGLARSLLALGTLCTLLLNDTSKLFRPGAGVDSFPICSFASQASIYCLLGSSHLEIARWVSIIVLFLVISGYFPRWTAIPHWWVTFSLSSSAIVVDGGDQVSSVLTLLMIPLALGDSRLNHWLAAPGEPGNLYTRWVALSAAAAIRLQVAGIYFHASIKKMQVPEWVDGTAMYYWLNSNIFGLPEQLRPLFAPLLLGPTVAVATWGVVLLELILAAALFMPSTRWRPLLLLGAVFHAAIAVFMGITSFAIAMMAALVLFLTPVEHHLHLLWPMGRGRPAVGGRGASADPYAAHGRSAYDGENGPA
ncbi:sporulation-delaying protein SdpB family protein [Calidithermus roseus]|uniref:Sporulation-delaying protein SdpB n=1 Tax=Calidithermus roseus TaxID=1644118 RepID=A0A399EGE6_9DEIN|nr:sporulation-delaying protein SdpB family protein [Calidithermus roseus]RIH83205.1 Sporulation-delaying protein SdpB [Calidithermus roseus]